MVSPFPPLCEGAEVPHRGGKFLSVRGACFLSRVTQWRSLRAAATANIVTVVFGFVSLDPSSRAR